MPKEPILKVIADNQALLDEVRKIFIAEFQDSPLEMGFSDERLGQRVRARMEGLQAIDRAFTKILAYQSLPPKSDIKNPAR